MKKIDHLSKHIRPGNLYRRKDLLKWSNAVDRHLYKMLDSGKLIKISGGLYLCPKQTAFGPAPSDDKALIAAFLKDNQFLITSPNAYNALGIGLTQLYNETIVYNNKRHGKIALGGRIFDFRRRTGFPKKISEEFLLVDLINNLDSLAEDRDATLSRIKKKVMHLNQAKLHKIAHAFGKVRTRKFFNNLITESI